MKLNMNKIAVKPGRTFNKVGFVIKKHSPEILAVAGTVGVIASGVLACKATTKLNSVMTEMREQIDEVHEASTNEELKDKYTVEDAKKDVILIYTQTGIKLAKLYGPSIALATLSLGSLLASNNILRKRNVALAAAYATVDKNFKEYRNRVIERFGGAVDKELKYNIKKEKIEETVTDPETGKEKKVKQTVETADPLELYSPYARMYDAGNNGWSKDPEYNLMFLRKTQQYANDLLRSKGILFLNDVYRLLGFPETKEGQIVGWYYDPENPIGDNYVDFGLYDIHKRGSRDFVNGFERAVILDFNVDGNVWQYM